MFIAGFVAGCAATNVCCEKYCSDATRNAATVTTAKVMATLDV
jgi:hypothetical protein